MEKKSITLKMDDNQLEIRVRDNLDARGRFDTFEQAKRSTQQELEINLKWMRAKIKAGTVKHPAPYLKTIAIINFVLSNK